MPSLDKIVEELQFLSDRLSTQVRTLGLGMIALVWALLSGASSESLDFKTGEKHKLILVAVLALVAMTLDFLQYVFGYVHTNRLHRELLDEGRDQGDYDYHELWYRARAGCFWAKQVVIFTAVVWLVWVMSWHLL